MCHHGTYTATMVAGFFILLDEYVTASMLVYELGEALGTGVVADFFCWGS